ncbi:MAG: RluA family pseudouridine synthase [Caulobacteraceae bacterium]
MIKQYTVNCGGKKEYIIDYMTGTLGFSGRKSKLLIKDRKVLINGKAAFRDSRLKDGDLLELDLSEEAREEVVPENIGLNIVYEDDFMLVVDKPPFMLVHPTPNHQSGTLLNAVAYHFSKQGIHTAVRLLNRLDMNTSGLVVVPKSSEIHSRLGEMMRKGEIKKCYTAIIEGSLSPEKGIIDKAIDKDPDNPIKRKVMDQGQRAVTKYETIKEIKGYSILRLELVTGRTHQIRVHLSHLGHPIVGDSLYGKASPLIDRQALHAYGMEFMHPVGGNTVKLHAELPRDIEALISEIESE